MNAEPDRTGKVVAAEKQIEAEIVDEALKRRRKQLRRM